MGTCSRRRFLGVLGGSLGALGLPRRVHADGDGRGEGDGDEGRGGRGGGLPRPEASGIDHVVLVTMENRSFDHALGWLAGADGRQAGLSYLDRAGAAHPTHRLVPDYQGCGHPDPDHSFEGGRAEWNGGACDGWLRAGANDDFAIGYYAEGDLPFLGGAARAFTACDRWFSPVMAETYPNRIYQHAGVTDRLSNTAALCALPTIWDRLAARRVSGRYYYGDIPFVALWGAKYLSISRPYAAFLADAAAGTLPAVSYVDPRFAGEEEGTSGDDHPHGDVRGGESFLAEVYRAVTSGPGWPRTLLVVTFDEWGGFFDHVPPPRAPDVREELRLRGFRVPALLVSPFARRGHVAHEVYDHASFLKLLEWRFGLARLSVRDAAAANLAGALDLGRFDAAAPSFPVLPFPASLPCPPPLVGEESFAPLAELARRAGFPLGA
jgi:phospholipase C